MGGAVLNFHARGEALWQERAHELHRSALGVSLTDKFVQKCPSCEPLFPAPAVNSLVLCNRTIPNWYFARKIFIDRLIFRRAAEIRLARRPLLRSRYQITHTKGPSAQRGKPAAKRRPSLMARPPERSQPTRLLHFNPKLIKLVWGNVLTVRPFNTRAIGKQADFREIIGVL